LQQLEDEGLIRLQETPERKVFELTETGRAWLAEHAEETRNPWHDHGRHVPEGTVALMHGFKLLAAAGWQVAQTGTPAQVARAREIIDAARRDLYRILAGDDATADATADATTDATRDATTDPTTES
jgi:DNA-binding PadR family transcriptional regulator